MLDPYTLNAFLYFKEEIIWKKFGKMLKDLKVSIKLVI